MTESVSGVVRHIIFHNEENGYTVFNIDADGEELTCIGFFGEIREGFCLDAEGTYTEHPAYGRQFRVERGQLREPESTDAIETYIGSGAIKGIGKAMAARIVRQFGDDTLRILEEEPERLAEVKGISARRAREIGTQAAEQAGMRKAMIFLSGFGISLKLGIRIFQEYGDALYEILRTNPYKIAEDIEGVGFLTADKIAREAGIAPDSEYRIRSGLLYVLMNAAGEGSVYLPEMLLYRRTSQLLGPTVSAEAMQHELTQLSFERQAVIEELDEQRIVYWGSYYTMEMRSARMLLDLEEPTGVTEKEAAEELRKLERDSDIQLGEDQQRAVVMAAMHGLMILTGGPGTGKTTTINEIIRYFRRNDKNVMLAAPTGRAAKRMTETTGYAASTIHRMLEISGGVGEDRENVRFTRNESNPLEADVIIIDEMSMVDMFLMHALLSAVAVGTRLILVGDVDQLPSVGAGAVLRDMIRSEAFPCVRLTRIFRQAEASDIVVNAHRINRGEQIVLDNKSRDFFLLRRNDPNRLVQDMIGLIRTSLPPYLHCEPGEIQVLSPMRKGALGVENLNVVLQEALNPPDRRKAEKLYGEHLFREGDKVMQTKNNYQLEWEIRGKNDIPVEFGSGIFNGDMGVIREISDFAALMVIEFDDGRIVDYPYGSLEELELAYAVTIHKSQGSEYPAVILPLMGGPRMLMTRNLLYTAVTRARNCAVMMGSEETVRNMIDNTTEQRRFTSLDRRIREMLGEYSL